MKASGHVERVQALIDKGKIEDAKSVHNTAIVLAKAKAQRSEKFSLKRHMPAFREAKKRLDAAEGK